MWQAGHLALGSCDQENGPSPSSAAALRKVGPAPHLVITVELTLVGQEVQEGMVELVLGSEHGKAGPVTCQLCNDVGKGEMPLPQSLAAYGRQKNWP